MKHIIIAVILIISNVFLGIAKPMKSQAEIYFAGGCFWGVEAYASIAYIISGSGLSILYTSGG